MKTIKYTAFNENKNLWNNSTITDGDNTGYCDSKIAAINELRKINQSADLKLRRIDKEARSEMHFIQLCANVGIKVSKHVLRSI